jgi:integrase
MATEACDLRWDDIDLPKRTIIVRRLKGSTDSSHYLERDELAGLKWLQRQQAAKGIKGAYVFVNERGHPFGRMGIGRMVERAGEAAKLRFPVHVHISGTRRATHWRPREWIRGDSSTFWGMPRSPIRFVIPR